MSGFVDEINGIYLESSDMILFVKKLKIANNETRVFENHHYRLKRARDNQPPINANPPTGANFPLERSWVNPTA